jgi:hypothetical protein
MPSSEGLGRVFATLLYLLPVGLWWAWWLWAVNWTKAWPVLAQGAWAPVVLLMLMATMVWSRIAPTPCDCLGFVTVPNGWWQLGSVCALVATALFCGWVQGYFGWTPTEVSVQPPPAAHGDGHAPHGHH